MATNDIIMTITEKLKKYPNIRFETANDNELNILKENDSGFDICIQTADRENTMHFDSFHWHYDSNENETNEMLAQLIFALTGTSRIKELSRNEKAYKWILQIQDRENNWHNNGTMGTINFNFFSKSAIKYYQNSMLPKEKLFEGATDEQ
jgi:hypothetical protein